MSRRGLYALFIVLGLIILGVLFIVFRQPAESAAKEFACTMTNSSGGVMGLPEPACPAIQKNLVCTTVASATDTITLGKFKGEQFSYDTNCTYPGGPNIFHYSLGGAPPGPTSLIDKFANSHSAAKSIGAVNADTIYISYYDNAATSPTDGDLKFAKSTNGGASWTDKVIDSNLSGGLETSLAAFDGNTLTDTDDTIYISYFDHTTNDLKVAKSTNGGASWAISTVDGGGDHVADYNSLVAFEGNTLDDTDDTVYISYREFGSGINRLKFAKTTDGGATAWTLKTVDSDDAGAGTSIAAFDGNTRTATDDTIYISYRDNSPDSLRVAKSTNGGASWTPKILVEATTTVGWDTSIVAVEEGELLDDTDDRVYISYRDSADYGGGDGVGALKFARTVDGGSTWVPSVVDKRDNVGGYSSIDAIAGGNPDGSEDTVYIAYSNQSNNNLKLAGTTDATSTSWAISVADLSSSRFNSLYAVDATTIYITFSSYSPYGLKFIVE